MSFFYLGNNFLEKLICYLKIFFQVCYGYMKNVSQPFFALSFLPMYCVSQKRFFGPIFKLEKVDLYTGKYGT